jgi:hypothetical protein
MAILWNRPGEISRTGRRRRTAVGAGGRVWTVGSSRFYTSGMVDRLLAAQELGARGELWAEVDIEALVTATMAAVQDGLVPAEL